MNLSREEVIVAIVRSMAASSEEMTVGNALAFADSVVARLWIEPTRPAPFEQPKPEPFVHPEVAAGRYVMNPGMLRSPPHEGPDARPPALGGAGPSG